jgi:eukaryotic-like serine/threonine-protein kinase
MRDESSSELDPVGLFMADCLALPPEEHAAAVDAWLDEHPELREELRARLALLDEMGFNVPELGSRPAGVPERLGDFRLIEKLGSGGMGVVYRAEQLSLGREVALKLIRPELLYFEQSRARFRREVEAVAQLKHPGIVPVYTVGEENGLPYFAMEYVQGGTLSQALERLAERAPRP